MRIGFIGLGNMGGGMAANLVRGGHKVCAVDSAPEALARAREHGCEIAAGLREAVVEADAVISMLPNGAIVRGVYDEVMDHAPPHALLIDCSTIDVATARDLATTARRRGYAMIDAPVSGGIAAAAGGTLTFMVGGEEADFMAAQGVLGTMGKVVIHAGPNGAGQAAKVCNNMLLGASMIATCEAFSLAGRLGLDLQTFYDISSKASGQCWSMTSYCPVPGVGPETPADHGYEGGFATALMLKDLTLAMEAAQGAGAAVPMGRRAQELYTAFAQAGNGRLDFTAIIRTL